MRTPLLELLAHRPIVHPTRIASGSFANGDLLLTIEGFPWWSEGAPAGDGALLVSFIGVRDGHFDPRDLGDGWDEALEDFAAVRAADVDWLQPSAYSIFCSAPLPDPLALYARVHDFLADAGAFRTAGEFLNGAEVLTTYRSIVGSSSYNLARGPAVIRDLVRAELVRQDVVHNVLESDLGVESGLYVVLGGSQFLCSDAWAEPL